jgi:hypothetical protein
MHEFTKNQCDDGVILNQEGIATESIRLFRLNPVGTGKAMTSPGEGRRRCVIHHKRNIS